MRQSEGQRDQLTSCEGRVGDVESALVVDRGEFALEWAVEHGRHDLEQQLPELGEAVDLPDYQAAQSDDVLAQLDVDPAAEVVA